MRHHRYLLVVLAFVASATEAQQVTSHAPGSRVRLTPAYTDTSVGRAGRIIEGRLVSMDHDSVTITLKGNTRQLSLPFSAVDRLDVAAGRDRGKGALIGATIGGGLAAGFGLVTIHCSEPQPCIGSKGGWVATYGMLGAIVGGITGLMIGTAKWDHVDVPLKVAITPLRGGGVGAGLAMRF